jgi:hypothetical protein
MVLRMSRFIVVVPCLLVLWTSAAPAQPISGAVVPDGVYLIGSGYNGQMCADIGSENVNKVEDNIHHFPCNGTTFQQWRITKAESEGYEIRWEGAPGKLWTVENLSDSGYLKFQPSPSDGSAYQRWRIRPANGADRQYLIISSGSGRCVDFNSSDNPTTKGDMTLSRPCNDGLPEHRWILNKIK